MRTETDTSTEYKGVGKFGEFMSKTQTATSPPREGEPAGTSWGSHAAYLQIWRGVKGCLKCLWCFRGRPRSCAWSILHISYKDHVTNEEVRTKIQQAVKPHEDLLTIVNRHKLQWYGHVSLSSGLAKTILQGTVKGGRRRGRQRKRWEDIREWTGLEFGRSQKKLVAKSSVVPQRPSRLRDRWWRWWWLWCSYVWRTDRFLTFFAQSTTKFTLGRSKITMLFITSGNLLHF